MAEEHDSERTESASPRRLEQAREEGNVARSQELTTFALLMAGAAGLWFYGAQFFQQMCSLLLSGLPEPLYVLFGTGYLGYTAARQWGKVAGSDK